MATRETGKVSARDRLLNAANELFYDEGVRSVGIDRVIEHAGVAKATLYNTFGSKEALIGAYLEARHGSTAAHVTGYISRYDTPYDQLLGVFEAQGVLFADPGFHGCAFVSATAESQDGDQAQQAADAYRAWVRQLFTDLGEKAGVPEPESLARQLQLLYDGGGLAARMDRDPAAAKTSRAAAQVLLDAALASAGKSGKSAGKTARG